MRLVCRAFVETVLLLILNPPSLQIINFIITDFFLFFNRIKNGHFREFVHKWTLLKIYPLNQQGENDTLSSANARREDLFMSCADKADLVVDQANIRRQLDELQQELQDRYCDLGKSLLELVEKEDKEIGALVDKIVETKRQLLGLPEKE